MKFLSIYSFLVILFITSAYGQVQNPQVINVTGGVVDRNGYVLEWSIGELALVNQMASTDSSNIITNGFIQPYPAQPGAPVNVLFTPGSIAVYPNPTQDVLTINFQQIPGGKFGLQIANEIGQVVYKDEIFVHGFGFSTRIDMRSFRNGVYLLNLYRLNPAPGENNLESGTYKIIKQ